MVLCPPRLSFASRGRGGARFCSGGYTHSGVRRLRTLLLARSDDLLQPGHQMLHIKGPRLDEIHHATVNGG